MCFLKQEKNSVASVTGVQLTARINVTACESNKINFWDHLGSSKLVLEKFLLAWATNKTKFSTQWLLHLYKCVDSRYG